MTPRGQLPILTPLCLDPALRRLGPQLQAHLAVQPVDPLGYDDSRSAPRVAAISLQPFQNPFDLAKGRSAKLDTDSATELSRGR